MNFSPYIPTEVGILNIKWPSPSLTCVQITWLMRWQWLDAVSAVRAADLSSFCFYKFITALCNSSKVNNVRHSSQESYQAHAVKWQISSVFLFYPLWRKYNQLLFFFFFCLGIIFPTKRFISWPTTEAMHLRHGDTLLAVQGCSHVHI